jgi:hypothetical protein
MRWIGRGICIAVVFIVIGLIGLNIDIVPLRVERSDGSLIDVRTATPVITYRLDKRDWLDFAVAGNGPRLKILTNAIIDTSLDDCQPAPSSKLAQDAKPAPCRYAVEYQLLNADDELLSHALNGSSGSIQNRLDPRLATKADWVRLLKHGVWSFPLPSIRTCDASGCACARRMSPSMR